jgi:hypothetical protein
MANNINLLSSSNTFLQWLTATQSLVNLSNKLTEGGPADVFTANTNVHIENDLTIGGDLTVSGNITLDAIGFDNLNVNGTANIVDELIVGGISSLRKDLVITGNISVGNAATIVENTANFSGTTIISSSIQQQANIAVVTGTSGGILNLASHRANSAASYANSAFLVANSASTDALAFSIALG